MKRKKINIGYNLFVLEGIPIIIYPFVLLANIMSLAAERSSDEKLLVELVMEAFIFLTTTYPGTYIVSLISYKKEEKIWKALIPLVHLVLCILFSYLWSAFGE